MMPNAMLRLHKEPFTTCVFKRIIIFNLPLNLFLLNVNTVNNTPVLYCRMSMFNYITWMWMLYIYIYIYI
jgi:hypothetical protein